MKAPSQLMESASYRRQFLPSCESATLLMPRFSACQHFRPYFVCRLLRRSSASSPVGPRKPHTLDRFVGAFLLACSGAANPTACRASLDELLEAAELLSVPCWRTGVLWCLRYGLSVRRASPIHGASSFQLLVGFKVIMPHGSLALDPALVENSIDIIAHATYFRHLKAQESHQAGKGYRQESVLTSGQALQHLEPARVACSSDPLPAARSSGFG